MSTPTASPSRQDHLAALAEFAEERAQHADTLGARGPMRFDTEGRLSAEIVDAYERLGFYVLTDVVAHDEVVALRDAVNDLVERAPVRPRADVDRHGRPAAGRDHRIEPFVLTKPLSDPWGGTTLLAGRSVRYSGFFS